MAKASGQGRVTIQVEPFQLKQLFSLLSALPKDSQNEIRDSAQMMSKRLAGQLLMSSHGAPAPQTRLVAQTISTPRDRLIRVDIGGSKKVGRKWGGETSKNGKSRVRQQQAPAGALLWGTEFGSHAASIQSVVNTLTASKLLQRRADTGSIQPSIITRQ